jgi:hypothetical protein
MWLAEKLDWKGLTIVNKKWQSANYCNGKIQNFNHCHPMPITV